MTQTGTVTQTPADPISVRKYGKLLGKAAAFLSESERIEMRMLSRFFREKIAESTIALSEFVRDIRSFVDWLRKEVLWREEHNGSFFSKLSTII